MLPSKSKSKKGFSLPLAIGITAVLILLSASLIAIAATSIVSTSSSVNQRQAYLNVRSALEYAFAYYSDANYVSDLSEVQDQYMAMNDTAGGTVEAGARIVSKTEAEAAKTYVYANYTSAVGTTPAYLKVTAYSKSSDAFGKKVRMVHMSAIYTINNFSSKNRVTLTDIDMSTEVDQSFPPRDAISLHVKQYPGQEWTPFYYTWTYKDVSGLYDGTDDCYSVDNMYKSQVVKQIYADMASSSTSPSGVNISSKGIYYDARQWFWGRSGGNYWNSYLNAWVSRSGGYYGWQRYAPSMANESSENYYNKDAFKYTLADGATKSTLGIIPAMNKNHDDTNNKYEPSSPWNVVPGNSADPKNGPASYFNPSTDGGGWYDASYYVKTNQVNYFNMILTTKGKVVYNTETGKYDTEGVQTNEMFHLWFLNPEDKNIYFEFLQPGLKYSLGSTWNGHANSDDRYIVYLSNKKTAVHLKVKGYGNSGDAALNAPTAAPEITSVTVNSKNIFQDSGTYKKYAAAIGGKTASDSFRNMFYRGTDTKSFFYTGEADNSAKFMYEGCGWWVANIPTNGSFRLNFKVTRLDGRVMSYGYTVKSSSSDEAYVVIDFTKGYNAVSSWQTEEKAMEYISEDINSYVTVAVKTSEIGTPVAPYLDYTNSNSVLSKRRELYQWIKEAENYTEQDYENFTALNTAITAGVELYNKVNYVKEQTTAGRTIEQIDQDYATAINNIKNAINALTTKICDSKTYQDLEEQLYRAETIFSEQTTDYLYEPRAVQSLRSNAAYTTARSAVDTKAILNNEDNPEGGKYTTSYVKTMVNALKTVIDNFLYGDPTAGTLGSVLDKSKLKEKLEDVSDYVDNSRFDAEPQNDLKREIAWAEALMSGQDWPEGRELPTSITGEPGYEDETRYGDLTASSTIQQRIDRQVIVLDIYMHKVMGDSNITGLVTTRIADDIKKAREILNRSPKINCTDETYENLKAAVESAETTFKNVNSTNEDYFKAACLVEDAIRSFDVNKPGVVPVYIKDPNDNSKYVADSNSYPTQMRPDDPNDLIEANGNIRVWLSGMNTNTSYQSSEYEDYKNPTDAANRRKSRFKDVYTVDSFSIEAYKGAKLQGIISSGNANECTSGSSKYAYVDIPSDFATAFSFALDVKKTSYIYDTDTRSWVQSYSSYISFIMDPNEKVKTGYAMCYTVTADDLVMSTPDENAVDTAGHIVREYKLNVNAKRLSEVYINAPEAPKVELIQKKTETVGGGDPVTTVLSTEEIATSTEHGFYVARFFYEENQYLKVSYQNSTRTFTYKFTTVDQSDVVEELKTQVGQYYLTADMTDTNTSHCTYIIPKNSRKVSFEDTKSVMLYQRTYATDANGNRLRDDDGNLIKIETEYLGVYDESKNGYVVTVPAIVADVYTIRTYTSDEGEKQETNQYDENVNQKPGCIYTFNYRSDSEYGVTTNYDSTSTITLRAMYIPVDSIYRKYAEESETQRVSYGTTGSSATITDFVSDQFADKLLTVPLAATANVTDKFDYFGQAGDDKEPVINIGNTVIWIEKEVILTHFHKSGDEYYTPNVYVLDQDFNELHGEYPGRPATRVEDTNYFYCAVPSNAYICILSYKNDSGKNIKVGGSRIKENGKACGHIYLDDCDIHTYGGRYQGNQLVGYTWTGYSTCQFGADQGMCCLYQKIDNAVLSGSYKKEYYGTVSGLGYFLDDIKYDHLDQHGNKVTGDAPKDRTGSGNKYTYKYRTKKQDKPIEYEREERVVDKSDMAVTDLRMAFIGGRKIRIINNSYYNNYTNNKYSENGRTRSFPVYSGIFSSLRESNDAATEPVQKNITDKNPYGGGGGNKESMGRIGDAELTMIYDWYERKIPVDAADEYTIQIQGLRYNYDYIQKQHKTNRKWYDLDYVTDDRLTKQISGIYGNVWLKLNDSVSAEAQTGDATKLQRYNNIGLFTTNPDTVQIKDDQDIYFLVPDDSWSVSVKARGVDGQQTESFVDSGDRKDGKIVLKAVIKGNRPFLTFEASSTSGASFTSVTSLKGNDNILYNMAFNYGTGGWDSYVPPALMLERQLYSVQQLYYGSVWIKEYEDDGTAKNLGNAGSFEYAEALNTQFQIDHQGKDNSHYFDNGMVNRECIEAKSIATIRSEYDNVASWTIAYRNLYKAMAQARAYIPKSISGQTYLEYLHNGGKADIYNTDTVRALYDTMMVSKGVYVNSGSTINSVVQATTNIERAIDDITIDTDRKIAIVYYDIGNYVSANATFELAYDLKKENPSLSDQKKIKVTERNTEHMPITFVEPATGQNSIYNVRFIINNVEIGKTQDEIPLDDSAWVYIDLPTNPYWIMNAVADYRDITLDRYQQGKHDATFTMNRTRSTKSETNLALVQYRPITLYFRKNVDILNSDGSVNYTIKAGAYSFETKDVNTADSPLEASSETRNINGSEVVVLTEAPKVNLFSAKAKTYFEDPWRYYEYTTRDKKPNTTPAENLTEDDISSGEDLGGNWWSGGALVAGNHNSTQTLNLTYTSGEFTASRVWDYNTTGKLYFRWSNNSDLYVNNNVTFTANEIRFASSGTINATKVYNKHLYFCAGNNAKSMTVVFPTDIHVKYYDKYRDLHEFTIREGTYIVEKATKSQRFIADLCDEEYWTSMEHVVVNPRYESQGGSSNSTDSRLGTVTYTVD